MRKMIALVAGAMLIMPAMAADVINVNVTVDPSLVTTVDTTDINLNLAAPTWAASDQAGVTVMSNYDVTVTADPSGDLFDTSTDSITAQVGLGLDSEGAIAYEAEGVTATEVILDADSSIAGGAAATTVNVKATGSSDTPADDLGTGGIITVTFSTFS